MRSAGKKIVFPVGGFVYEDRYLVFDTWFGGWWGLFDIKQSRAIYIWSRSSESDLLTS